MTHRWFFYNVNCGFDNPEFFRQHDCSGQCCSFEHNTISVNISRVHTKTYNIEYTGKYLTWQTLKIYSHNRKWNYSSTENERYSYSVINAVELKLLGSYLLVVTHLLTGADPGFAVGGGANPRREGGASRYKFVRFSEKTAWNLKNFGPWGGDAPLGSASD